MTCGTGETGVTGEGMTSGTGGTGEGMTSGTSGTGETGACLACHASPAGHHPTRLL